MNIPFNMEYDIDEALREIPKDRNSFAEGIDFILKESNGKTGVEKARLLSQAGVYQRIHGDLNESLFNLEKARALLSNTNQPRLQAINDIRIAQTLQFLQRFDESEKLYLRLQKEIQGHNELNSLLDFVCQHRGKLLFDQCRFSEAQEQFKRALELRIRKNDQELIDSTLLAVGVTKRKLAE